MSPEERIRNKVSGLKQVQNEKSIRKNFDATIGRDGEAFKTQYGGLTYDPYTGRAYHNAGDYVYGAEELQKAMDNRNTNNRMNASIFDYVFKKTGNPNMARHAVNTANFTPGVGTVMGVEDAYQAAREIPDDYRAGNPAGVAKNVGFTALGLGDAALTMAPFAKPIFNAMKRVPSIVGGAGRAMERGMFAVDDMMAPTVNAKPQNALMEELERYLEKTENITQPSNDFGFDDYLNRVNPGQKRIEDNARPNLRMGDMYGMLPRNSELVGSTDQVKFFRGDDGGYYATAYNPDLGEEDVVGFIKNYGNETELAVVSEMQGKGIGGELQYLFRSENFDAPSGGLTQAGEKTLERTYDRLFDEGFFENLDGRGLLN